jgi:hypothetical protein
MNPAAVEGPSPPPVITVEPPAATAKSRVHLTSTATVYFQHMDPTTNNWVDVCTAPCEAEVTRGDRYRVAGAGITRDIVVDQPYVDIAIDPPSPTKKAVGMTGIVVGGLTTFIGFVYTMIGIEHADFDCTYPQRSYHTTKAVCERDVRNAPTKRDGGIVAMSIGAAITLGSIYLVATSSRSNGITEKKSPDPPPKDAWLREPTWRASVPSARLDLPFVWEGRF